MEFPRRHKLVVLVTYVQLDEFVADVLEVRPSIVLVEIRIIERAFANLFG